jgi:N-acetylneuraminic acid mutarotase
VTIASFRIPAPLVLGSLVGALVAASAAAPAHAQSPLQVTPDNRSVLVSKDVGGERWAVTRKRADGSVSGNVFFPAGGNPLFVWCSELAENADEATYACSGADRCVASPCLPSAWTFVDEVHLPQDFFLPEDDQAPGTWRELAPLGDGARQENPVVAFRGEIFVFGGFGGSGQLLDTVEAYDPVTNRWRNDIARLPLATHHTNVAVSGGRIYVVGFLTGGTFAPHGRVFAYDPERNVWEERAGMPAGTERGASAVGAIDGRIYVAGGSREVAVVDFSAYDPGLDSWEVLPDLPEPLDHATAGTVDGRLYVLGGRGGSIGAISGDVYEYDPASRAWRSRAEMPTPRGGVAGATLGGLIYVLGGEGNPTAGTNGVFPDVEVFDPAANRWDVLPPMAVPRHGTGAAGLADKIYVPGGATRQGFGAVATVDAFEPVLR